MAEYMHLIGAEDVRSAANQMRSAAELMQRAADNMGYSLETHKTFLENWLYQFKQVMEEFNESFARNLTSMHGAVSKSDGGSDTGTVKCSVEDEQVG